jgi:hypothetical protein
LLDIQNQFVRLKVYENGEWVFKNYPISIGKKQLEILTSTEWTVLSPTLVPKEKKKGLPVLKADRENRVVSSYPGRKEG